MSETSRRAAELERRLSDETGPTTARIDALNELVRRRAGAALDEGGAPGLPLKT